MMANIFHAGIVEGRKELNQQLVALGACAIVALLSRTSPSSTLSTRRKSIFSNPKPPEIELAREIHRSLVPTFERKLAGYEESFGASIPSGEVGGDLVDMAGTFHEQVAILPIFSGTASLPVC